jgi:hypothetical protein
VRDPNEKVIVAFLHPGDVEGSFLESMINLLMYDVSLHKRIVHGGGWLGVQAGANLAGPRNGIVKQFLSYGAADWLWMVDSDMTFSPDALERLLEHADPVKAPIVGALCFGFDDKGEVQPTLYGLDGTADDPEHVAVIRYHEWAPDTMMQVAATGTGSLLVHRAVFERMRNFADFPPQHPRFGKRGFNDAYPWFQETEHDGSPVGEDITFCWRAGLLEIPVWVNTAVQCGHVKKRLLTAESYFLGRGLLSPQHAGAGV